MNERPPIRTPTISPPRSAPMEARKRHPVLVRATFVRLSRQPGANVA